MKYDVQRVNDDLKKKKKKRNHLFVRYRHYIQPVLKVVLDDIHTQRMFRQDSSCEINKTNKKMIGLCLSDFNQFDNLIDVLSQVIKISNKLLAQFNR